MARANDGGWDFVKVGETYQYKENSFIAMVTVMEDNSTDKEYKFRLRIEKSNFQLTQNGEFPISHVKDPGGFYSGMMQIYETEEYSCNYGWERKKQNS